MRVTMLGCGSSTGVPVIGCHCPVCTSNDPKNKRSRVSVWVETDGVNFLIDSSPDLRQQALSQGISRVDAVLYTHDHADHTNGLDDLRAFNMLTDETVPVYANAPTLQLLQQRFPYAFLPKPRGWYRPALTPHAIAEAPIQRFTALSIPITAFEQQHGKSKTLGYRIGDFAYSTDTDGLSDIAFEALSGVQLWLVDCLRYGHSHSHSNLAQTLAWIGRVRPRLAILTHMAHDFDYHTLSAELPAGVMAGYDGMIIDL